MSIRFLCVWFKVLGNHFRQVLHLNIIFALLVLDAVTHHGHTERTGDCDRRGLCLKRFLRPFNVNVLIPFLGFFKHLCAASSTAQPGHDATTLHFSEVGIQGF